MLNKIEINNIRAFLTRVTNIQGHETIEHVRCLQALTREEQELETLAKHKRLAEEAARRAAEEKPPQPAPAPQPEATPMPVPVEAAT